MRTAANTTAEHPKSFFLAAQRVCGEAEPTPEQERNNTAAGHAECMNIEEIKCLETSLDEETAGQKLESLLSQLHNNAQSHHETRVMFRDNGHCWIPDHRIVNKAVAVMYGRRDRAQES